MSGIVGYVGVQPALDVVLAGLGRLADATGEVTPPGGTRTAAGSGAADGNRAGLAPESAAPESAAPGYAAPGHDAAGYDAAGVAVLADGGLATARTPGTLDDLTALLRRRPLPSCGTALGQLRAAPRGGPTAENTPPRLDSAGRVAVVHHGTLTNGATLRAELAGHGRRLGTGTGTDPDTETDPDPEIETGTHTDTDAIARLLAEALSAVGDLGEALRLTTARLAGPYAVAAVHTDDPDALAVAGDGLPLLAAVGDGEAYLTSAVSALPPDVAPGERPRRGAAPWRLVDTAEVPGGVLLLRRSGDELRHEVPAA